MTPKPLLRQPKRHYSGIRARTGEPKVSWWLDLDRSTLNRKAEEEQPRMRSSIFGRLEPGKIID